jgi:hypothetical protein
MNANKQHKSSLFELIFGNEDTARELYNSLSDNPVPPDAPVHINTLENAIFMDRINDLSFTVGDNLVILVEHQSTINPNMALRLLLYIARIYEKIIDSSKLYSTEGMKIPHAEFYVLYNGIDPYEDEQTIKLSDLYKDAVAEPMLDLTVKVYNINKGHNVKLLAKSHTLDEYTEFIATVRSFEAQGMVLAEALEASVKDCIKREVLVDLLKLHGSEVCNMLFDEWDWDKFVRMQREEADRQRAMNDAFKAIKLGIPTDVVQQITGLDMQTISNLAKQ